MYLAVLLFSKLNKIFFGYFDLEKIFLDNEINNFQGELTDVSAIKAALAAFPIILHCNYTQHCVHNQSIPRKEIIILKTQSIATAESDFFFHSHVTSVTDTSIFGTT